VTGTAPGKPGRLRHRREFLSLADSRLRAAETGVVLQARKHDRRQHPAEGEPDIRFGLTATKKTGGAVQRNRIRRRLRALAVEMLPKKGLPGHDYVLIGRAATLDRDFALLRQDLEKALARVHGKAGGGA
jgi:ribonuclease P protein component